MTALSLKKDQSLSLVKDNGSALTKVRLGLGWDEVPRKHGLFGFGGAARDIDLDASAILIGNGRVEDVVFYNALSSADGAVRHSGDNLTGGGDGDDEQIVIDLDRVSPRVDTIVLTITSYSGQTFNEVANVFARVVDLSSGSEQEVVRYDLADGGNETANLIAKLTRHDHGWDFTALGVHATAKTPQQLLGRAVQV